MFTPLEQFENHVHAGHFSVVFQVGTLGSTVLMNVGLVFGVLWLGFSLPGVLRSAGIQNLVETWWSGVTGVVRQQLGKLQLFTPLFVWTFGWLAIHNLVGLVPLNFTVTAHLSTTLFLALGFNLGFLYWGFQDHGLSFLALFVPAGAPRPLLPLIVVIEVVSYLIRPLSLALRLFANMMAGHTLVHILLGFAAGLGLVGMVLSSAAIAAVTLLEVGIALLQAYVFVVLCCIYVRDALEPAH